ncbi:MAG: hypothetical protein H6613_05720 [Ignavibacteriales bacterium]|nr:hypothetical protein [Ignavibacteriales bacterium]
MKNVIVYAVIFIVAFLATTFGVYTFNNKYANMFEFDFRDAAKVEAALVDSLAIAHGDSLTVADSLVSDHEPVVEKGHKIATDLKVTKGKLNEVEEALLKKEEEIKLLESKVKEKEDEKYAEWLKNTIKLYEAMESTKAAQFIKAMPENEARDLIYSMKKKKAAEVLSYLSAETVNRLTRAQ